MFKIETTTTVSLYYTILDATLSGTELCAVNYTSSLVLHCPVNSSSTSSSSEPSYGGGEWWRENPLTGELSGICHNSVCTISEPLSNQDSGLYFCQENNKTYPVHITILGLYYNIPTIINYTIIITMKKSLSTL